MILIAAPEETPTDVRRVEVESPSGAPVDSMAMTKEGIAPEFQPSELAPPQTFPDEYHLAPESEEADSDPSPEADWQAYDEEPVPTTASNSEDWENDEPLVPTGAWESERSSKTKQYLLLGFLALASFAVATVGFFTFMSWYKSSRADSTLSQNADQNDVQSPNLRPNTDIENPSPDSPSLEGGDSETGALPPDQTQSPDSPDSGTDAEASVGNEQASSGLDEASPDNPKTNGMDNSGTPMKDLTPSELPPSLANGSFGEDIDSGSADQPLIDLTELDRNSKIKAALPNASFQEMASAVLDYDAQFIPTHTDVLSGPPPVTAADLGLATGINRTAIPDINLGERMSVALPGVMFPDTVSLATNINSWTQISGIPTSIDLDALAAINVNASKSPKILVEKSTMADVVNQLASQLGLQAVAQENRFLLLTATSDDLKSSLPESYDISGLFEASAENNEWLQESLCRMFGKADKSTWQIEGSTLTYDSTKLSLMEWMQVLRMLETWKAQLGLELLEGYSPARMVNQFVTPDRVTNAESILPLAQYTLQEEPVGQILSRTCNAMGIDCWIDWAHVGRNGLGPATTSVAVTHQRKLKDSLADFAETYGLEFMILDPQTLWVTTTERYRQSPRLFVLPSEGKTVEQMQQSLRPLTPVDSEGIREIVVLLTPDKKNALVRCCPPHLIF